MVPMQKAANVAPTQLGHSHNLVRSYHACYKVMGGFQASANSIGPILAQHGSFQPAQQA
ncbi:hypothetical protein DPMN_092087 [Dreissena polymorpha]|uniref:Uncharacterized protein n=1 Tax=Dreissena polymorpha TaxID=45954 RepID=A0A9D4L1P9_DREPO|nr:hypothetical protein DPMN_092087 [Dreissena polymorpha]